MSSERLSEITISDESGIKDELLESEEIEQVEYLLSSDTELENYEFITELDDFDNEAQGFISFEHLIIYFLNKKYIFFLV